MSGYNGWSKSNNACDAEACGRFPASVCAKLLRVPIKFVRAQHSGEWHHTSKHFNVTEYYDLEVLREHLATEEGQAELAQIKAKLKAKASERVEKRHKNCTVEWLEWSGTRNHPRAAKRHASGATIVDRGGQFVQVILKDGTTFRKGRYTRGFHWS